MTTPSDELPANPFPEGFYIGPLESEVTFEGVHEEGLAVLRRLALGSKGRTIRAKTGATVLLKSEKAGVGKTHFLARLKGAVRGEAVSVFLDLDESADLQWRVWFRRLVDRLNREDASADGESVLTLQASQLFASSMQALIAVGALEDDEAPEEAATLLLTHGSALYTPEESSSEVASWFHQCFESLRPKVLSLLSQSLGVAAGELGPWLDFLHGYGSIAREASGRAASRAKQALFLEESSLLSEIADEPCAKGEFRTLGRLISHTGPLFMVLDSLDWFFRDQQSALVLARMVSELNRMVPSSVVVISLNEDNWRETFAMGLPEAVQDRLTNHVVTLPGLAEDEKEPFLRAFSANERVEQVIAAAMSEARLEAPVTPRALLRFAAEAWDSLPVKEEVAQNGEAPDEASAASEYQSAPEAESPAAPAPAQTALSDVKALLERKNTGGQEPESVSSNPETLWLSALGDVRHLISGRPNASRQLPHVEPVFARGEASLTSNSDQEVLTPTIDPPMLTEEFRSFLSKLRSRAEGAHDYLPSTPGANSASERTRIRNAMILHGRQYDEHDALTSIKGARFQRTEKAAPWILSRLEEIRATLVNGPATHMMDLSHVRRLVETGGHLFPAIQQEMIALPDHPNKAVSRWRFQQNEILIGFEPASDTGYWQALVQMTAARARTLRESDKTRVKLVFFGHIDDDGGFPSWKPSEEDMVNLQFSDVILLTGSHLTQLYTVSTLLAEQPNEEIRQDVFVQVSGQLDFFWKMITRPVWSLVSLKRGEKNAMAS